MPQTEVSKELLSLIYATATDNSNWQRFCDAFAAYNGEPVLLFGHDICVDRSLGIMGGDIDPAELDRYHAHFASQNPWMHMNLALPVGAVGVSDAALPRRELFKTEFYNDWLRHQDNIVAGPAMICHRSKSRMLAMAGPCRARRVDDKLTQTVRLFESLAPHLMRSISISSAFSDGKRFSFRHTEFSPHAIFFLCHSGRVAHANRAALEFMKQSSLIRIDHASRLSTSTARLVDHLKKTAKAINKNNFAAIPPPVAIHSERHGRLIFHSHVFPIEDTQSFPQTVWSDPVAGAIVVAGIIGLADELDFQAVAVSLGASPAEARLADALMRGQSLYEYANANELSRHTVRNQMRALLHKTDTRNQAECVLLLARMLTPFSSNVGESLRN